MRWVPKSRLFVSDVRSVVGFHRNSTPDASLLYVASIFTVVFVE